MIISESHFPVNITAQRIKINIQKTKYSVFFVDKQEAVMYNNGYILIIM